jgi:GxxExxY protein
MDSQDSQDATELHEELSRQIIGCSFDVINELGAGFLESVYEKALHIALTESGLAVERQKPIEVRFRSQVVGDFYADLLVEGKILVELKAVKTIAPEHQAQIINYLNATGVSVGLLINFGNPRLEYKRFTRSKSSYPVYPVHPC